MENILRNGELYSIGGKYVMIGTSEIEMWTDGKPFIVPLETMEDFETNGISYADVKDMAIGDVKRDLDDYEGTMLIRIK